MKDYLNRKKIGIMIFLVVSFMCNLVFIYLIGTLNTKLDNVLNELETSEEVNMSIEKELSNARNEYENERSTLLKENERTKDLIINQEQLEKIELEKNILTFYCSEYQQAFDIDGLIPLQIDDKIKEDVKLMDVVYSITNNDKLHSLEIKKSQLILNIDLMRLELQTLG